MKSIIRKIVAGILCCLMISGSVPAWAAAEESPEEGFLVSVYATYGEGLALKEWPDLNAPRILRIPEGTQLQIRNVQNGWGYTEYQGYFGWVSLQYTRIIGDYPVEPPAAGYITPSYYTVYDTLGEGLELRTLPTTQASTFGPMMDGTTIVVEAVNGSWAYGTWQGHHGWAHLDYLYYAGVAPIEEIAPVPSQTPEPAGQQTPEPAGQESPSYALIQLNAEEDRPDFVEPEDLILYLGQNDLRCGEWNEMTFTVLYGSLVTGSVELIDENGLVLASLPCEGRGRITGLLQVYEEKERIGTVRAQSGGYASSDQFFYVHHEITEQMLGTLIQTAQDLGSFTEELSFDDPAGEETLQAVTEYLQQQDQVVAIDRVDDVIFYLTEDGLVGSYNMGVAEGDYAGARMSAEDAFDVYLDTANAALGQVFIESDHVMTNTGIKIITPQFDASTNDERTMLRHTLGILPMVTMLEHELGCTGEAYPNDDARAALLSGNFTDCGLLVINAHGGILYNRQGNAFTNVGDPVLFIDIGESSEETFSAYKDDFWGASWWVESGYANLDHFKVVCDITTVKENNVKKKRCSVRLGASYLADALEHQIFDNTIVYLFVCHALQDQDFIRTLTDHGAAAVIGCSEVFDAFYSMMVFAELTRSLITPQENGICGSVSDCLSQVSETSIDRVLDGLFAPGNTSIDDYFLAEFLHDGETHEQAVNWTEAQKRARARAYFLSKYQNEAVRIHHFAEIMPQGKEFRILGEAPLTGTVITYQKNDQGEPIEVPVANADVTAYQWLDHEFTEMAETVTDEAGAYRFDTLPVGLYVVQAKSKKMPSNVPAVAVKELYETDAECDPIVLNPFDWYRYIRDVLGPQMGYVSQTAASRYLTISDSIQSIGWDEREGILSAMVLDMTGDKMDDLLLFYYKDENVFETERRTCLWVQLYMLDEEGEVQSVGPVRIFSDNNIGYCYCKAGVMEIDGELYPYAESSAFGYFITGNAPLNYHWYRYDGTDLRECWYIGQTAGGSDQRAWGLRSFTYSEAETSTLQDDGAKPLVTWEDKILCADGDYLQYHPETVPVCGYGASRIEIATAGFELLGLPEAGTEILPQHTEYNVQPIASYIGCDNVTMALTYLCYGEEDGMNRNMTILTTDMTQLQDKLEELETTERQGSE